MDAAYSIVERTNVMYAGTGHWSEGSLVRKLYSRRVRVTVKVRVRVG